MGSLVALVLKWTGLSQGVMELIAFGAVAASITGVAVYEHHKIYTEGVTAARADQKKQDDADKAVLEARALTAEKNYADTKTQLDTYRNSNPIGAVRLCVSPPVRHLQTSSVVGISGGTTTSAANVQPLPAGDQGGGGNVAGPDIGPMLDLLAARADEVTAQAVELQAAH